MIAVDVLLGRRDDVHAPDAVLCIVDASNLERHLYLVSQVLELGLPTVIALNMVGSVTHAADLVVSDPVQAGTMAVMAIADTARFDLARQRGRRY